MPNEKLNRQQSSNLQPVSARSRQGAAAAAAAKVLAYQQATLALTQYIEPPQTEICLSPLLWSESFGLRLDG
jgi:hypothetical protein